MGEAALELREGEGQIVQGRLEESARRYAEAAKAPNTRRAYAGDVERFAEWCRVQGRPSLPAEASTVALYATELADAGRKVATIRRALTAVAWAHRVAGLRSPTDDRRVRELVAGIRREKGTRQRQAPPILPAQLRAMVEALPGDARGARDRAMLTVGFAGAFRRSELVAVVVDDLDFTEDGVVVAVRRSKTDQDGEGATVGLPYGGTSSTCPVRALRSWLERADVTEGPVFREVTRAGVVTERAASARAVDRAVKRAAKVAGLPGSFSAHSLRAGLATAAAQAGKGDRAIMRQGRWRSRTMVDRYVREAELFRDNAAAGIGT